MTASEPQVNDLWSYISKHQVNESTAADMSNFKRSEANFRLSCFDVETNGVRYLKALSYNVAAKMSGRQLEIVERTKHRNFGNPYSVEYRGISLCLDYIRAALEVDFIERCVDLAGAHVVEIGAGYGRTCHTLLSTADLATYTIIDLPTTIDVSRVYLRTVLDVELMEKTRFVSISQISELDELEFDLAVNVDSLAEMSPSTVGYYLDFISSKCNHFYCNNPVGKYHDSTLDGHSRGAAAVERAMQSGPLTNTIDIHNSEAVRKNAPAFLAAYRPADNWVCIADSWAEPFSWYWNAVYRLAT